jgi:hypothetical protein
MGIKTYFSVYIVGGLDAQGNCEVGAYEVDSEMLTGQVVLASYEVDIKQEWAPANDLIGTIKLSESLIATTTDRATVDSGEGTYVWNSRRTLAQTLWSAYTQDPSRWLPTQQQHSPTEQPSCREEIRTRWPA